MPDPKPIVVDPTSTRVRVALGALVSFFVAVCIAVATGTWKAAGYMHQQTQSLVNIETQIREVRREGWTRRDMREWGYELERLNRARGIRSPGLPEVASASDEPP